MHGSELWAAPRVAFNAACAGDCDEDGSVVVSELLLGVNLLLERADPAACIAVDRDLDDRVTVAELVAAVRRTLDGCARRIVTTTQLDSAVFVLDSRHRRRNADARRTVP